MLPCSVCGEPLSGEAEKIGARCPRCREPLYEHARDPHVSAKGGACAVHPANGAVATCARCGNFVCAVCWTRWQGQALCAACVGRALEAGAALPAEAKAHRRQAVLALLFGVVAWVTSVGSIFTMVLGVNDGNQGLATLGALLFFASPLAGVLGIGQGAAAIRARGDHMILATIGLLLGGLHAGMMVGMITFAIWNH